MEGFLLVVNNAGVLFKTSDPEELFESFDKEMFPRRYLPYYTLEKNAGNTWDRVDAVIDYHVDNEGFMVEKHLLGSRDEYWVRGSIPAPYSNEAPYFFTLQVLSRALLRRGFIVLTDSISFMDHGGRVHLVLGYPHDGKSSLSAIAYSMGELLLSTENTVVEARSNGLYIVNGSRMLVYDPRIHGLYSIPGKKPDYITRHGYYVVDLGPYPDGDYRVHDITLIHSSYRSRGLDYEELSGRKIMKTLWYFATVLIRGVDYYDPGPLDLSSNDLDSSLINWLRRVAGVYKGLFLEVFGSHREVYDGLVSGRVFK